MTRIVFEFENFTNHLGQSLSPGDYVTVVTSSYNGGRSIYAAQYVGMAEEDVYYYSGSGQAKQVKKIPVVRRMIEGRYGRNWHRYTKIPLARIFRKETPLELLEGKFL